MLGRTDGVPVGCPEDCIAMRPNFENSSVSVYPRPRDQPKSIQELFLMPTPRKPYSCPSNYKLVAAPLFELFDNARAYGPIISSLPQVLSRESWC
ncbi:hypothetical protein AHF37_12126 [Paragonimus kellicotti]|nr:hypothetical protein AHF37_12126 [Paragonimus kellicotti]